MVGGTCRFPASGIASPWRPRPLAVVASSFVAIFVLLLTFSLGESAPIDPADVPARLGLRSYEVAEGDTLLALAERFGISAETILWANDLRNKELLRVGQKLVILPVSGVLHRVRKGDTILRIAQAYGVEASAIVEGNGLSDAGLIREGDILIVPGGVREAVAPSFAWSGSGSSAGVTKYTVKPGDTLFSIAVAFGVKTSAILAANGMSNPDYLKIGQELLIPGGQQPRASSAAPPPPQQNPPAPSAQPQQERAPSARGDQRDGKSFVATVTSYCLRGRTASGTPVRWGAVAVDPRVIPLGSKIQIEGFEEVFVAEDTGSGVRGNWVDIWFENCVEARAFGMQSRRVTILE